MAKRTEQNQKWAMKELKMKDNCLLNCVLSRFEVDRNAK